MEEHILTHPYFDVDPTHIPHSVYLLDQFKNITGLGDRDVMSYRQEGSNEILVKVKANKEFRSASINSPAACYYFRYESPTEWLLHAISERSVN